MAVACKDSNLAKCWLSQARPSKWQPIVDLDTGVYFRTREISTLTLRVLICFFLPQHYVPYVLTSIPCREVTAGLGKLGRELGWFLLCHCCQHWPSTSLTGQGPWPFPSIYFYACPCSLGSSATSSIFPAASIFTTFFPDPLPHFFQDNHFSWTVLFGMEPQAPGFPYLNSLYAEA